MSALKALAVPAAILAAAFCLWLPLRPAVPPDAVYSQHTQPLFARPQQEAVQAPAPRPAGGMLSRRSAEPVQSPAPARHRPASSPLMRDRARPSVTVSSSAGREEPGEQPAAGVADISATRRSERAAARRRPVPAGQHGQALYIPLASIEIHPGDLFADPAVNAAAGEVHEQFVEDIGGPDADPSTPEYRSRWQNAQRLADLRLRARIGAQAFAAYQREAARRRQADQQTPPP